MAYRSDRSFYDRLNQARERCGLPTLSRREFGRLVVLASSGLSVPFFEACASEVSAGMPLDEAGRSTWPGAAGAAAPPAVAESAPATNVASEERAGQSNADTQVPRQDSNVQPPASSPSSAATNPPKEPNAAAGGKDSAPARSAATQPGEATGSCPTCARVGISRNSDVAKSVRTAIELAGGLGAIKQGDSVAIKPNITGTSATYVTHPEVLRGIILAVADYTAMENITVVECTALGANTRDNAMTVGVLPLVQELKANFLAFDEAKYVPFRADTWKHIRDEKRVPESLRNGQFDHFINAPILKNHTVGNAVYTCCLKNFVGLLPFNGAGSRMSDNIHTSDIAEKVAELGLIVPHITMNIVDATTPGLVNGPTPSTVADAGGLILASSDRVACDSLAVAVLKSYAKSMNVTGSYVNTSVFAQAQIVRAAELGLGIRDPKQIEIMAKDVDNLADIMAQWV